MSQGTPLPERTKYRMAVQRYPLRKGKLTNKDKDKVSPDPPKAPPRTPPTKLRSPAWMSAKPPTPVTPIKPPTPLEKRYPEVCDTSECLTDLSEEIYRAMKRHNSLKAWVSGLQDKETLMELELEVLVKKLDDKESSIKKYQALLDNLKTRVARMVNNVDIRDLLRSDSDEHLQMATHTRPIST